MCGQQYPCISITRCLAPETKCIGSADLKQVVSGIEAAFGPAQDYKPSADQVVMVALMIILIVTAERVIVALNNGASKRPARRV